MRKLVAKGEWNICIGVVGSPRCGKTTHALGLLCKLARTPAYVIVQDTGQPLPRRLPRAVAAHFDVSEEVTVLEHPSLDALRAAVAKPYPLGALLSVAEVDAARVLDFGAALGDASLRRSGGASGIPVVVYLDEIVSAENLTAGLGGRLKPVPARVIATRRHHHVGVVWGTQSPSFVPHQLLSPALATELHVFRVGEVDADGNVTDPRGLERLSLALLPHVLAQVPRLPKFRCIEYRMW